MKEACLRKLKKIAGYDTYGYNPMSDFNALAKTENPDGSDSIPGQLATPKSDKTVGAPPVATKEENDLLKPEFWRGFGDKFKSYNWQDYASAIGNGINSAFYNLVPRTADMINDLAWNLPTSGINWAFNTNISQIPRNKDWYTPQYLPGQNNPEVADIATNVASELDSFAAPSALVGGTKAAASALAKTKSYLTTTNRTLNRLALRQKAINQALPLSETKLKQNPEIRDAFSRNGLNPDNFSLKGSVSFDRLSTPKAFREGVYVRHAPISYRYGYTSVEAAKARSLAARGKALWAAPGEDPSIPARAGYGDRIVLNSLYLQKYKNGQPVITADQQLREIPTLLSRRSELLRRGVPIKNTGEGYLGGDHSLRMAMAQAQGLTAKPLSKQPAHVLSRLSGSSGSDLQHLAPGLEVVRQVPAAALKSTADVTDFIPGVHELPTSWNVLMSGFPQFVQKGGNSGLTIGNNLRNLTFKPVKTNKLSRLLAKALGYSTNESPINVLIPKIK